MCRYCFILAVVGWVAPLACADPAYPAWWEAYGLVTHEHAQPPASTDPEYEAWMQSNYAPANLGQLKWMATQAKAYVDAVIAPAASEWDAAYAPYNNPFPLQSNADDYAPANLGQAKFIANGIYQILENYGFEIAADIAGRLPDGTSWAANRPWTSETADDANYAAINLGQLKFVFAFDLSGWSPWGSVPDVWKQQIVDFDPNDDITQISDVLADADYDGDGISNLEEFLADSDPAGFYDALNPSMIFPDSTVYVGRAGCYLHTPLRVQLVDADTGAPIAGKPVSYSVLAGDAQVGASDGDQAPVAARVAWTDPEGYATVYVRLGATNENPVEVDCRIKKGGTVIAGTFSVCELNQAPYKLYAGGDNGLKLDTGTPLAVWGRNDTGQTGLGHFNEVGVPTVQSTPGLVASVAAVGNRHTVIWTTDGSLYGWGNNGFGQLGSGDTVSASAPVSVSLPSAWSGHSVVALAAGDNHTLALLDDGSLWAWGANSRGQLGVDTEETVMATSPVEVTALSPFVVKAVVACANNSIVLLEDGTVLVWGDNAEGQLGRTDVLMSDEPQPISLPDGALAVSVSLGRGYVGVCLEDGRAAMWGSNAFGQLGTGDRVPHYQPVAIIGEEPVVELVLGDHSSMALGENGLLMTWGGNSEGQLTPGLAGDDQLEPTVLSGVSGPVIRLSVGRQHVYITASDGQSMAWGSNQYDQLGADEEAPVSFTF